MESYDSVVVGSGPNGLSAGIALASAGQKVLIIEKEATVGGGMRTEGLTRQGFLHDTCSAVHPLGALSPYFNDLNLAQYGLEWVYPEYSVAHPLQNDRSVILSTSLERTVESLGRDGKRWKDNFSYFINNGEDLMKGLLKPAGLSGDVLLAARFGIQGVRSAQNFVRRFEGEKAKSLFLGCAAHSVLPLHFSFTSAVGMLFAISGHMVNWPVARGGSQSIARALERLFLSLGGEIRRSVFVKSLNDIPAARSYIFDTDPIQLAQIAEPVLPQGYIKRLLSYNFGPGVFKIDWALAAPVPWKDPETAKASVVHLAESSAAILHSEKQAWNGRHTDKPFIIYCQQSNFDSTRAPQGMHTGYAYCHVPAGSTNDMTAVIENQIEAFAPGFKTLILDRRTTNTKEFYAYNPNYFNGAVTGGASDTTQLFRSPVWRANPYTTPNPKIFICSAATPPGGGVHGMCGYWSAQAVLKRRDP